MHIVCVGGGPAGLYFSILMKKEDPAHRITVIERNQPRDTFHRLVNEALGIELPVLPKKK